MLDLSSRNTVYVVGITICLVYSQKYNTCCIMYIVLYENQKFDCVGRGDLTFLFESCEIDRSWGGGLVL